MERVGFIGLGIMGQPMARNLLRAGFPLTVYTRDRRKIEAFVDEMSNWYIRRSRDRFWGSGLTDDKIEAYQTLHRVLIDLARLIAPFTPFVAEDVYVNLGGGESVHLADYPQADESLIDEALERDMETTRRIVELARSVRNESGIKTRQPLSELIVSLSRPFPLDEYEAIIRDEVNVKRIVVEESDSGFVEFELKLNLKLAGKKYGRHVAPIQAFLKSLPAEDARRAVLEDGGLDWTNPEGETMRIALDELLVEKRAKTGFQSASGDGITVALNTDITPELEREGWVREVIRAVQDTRKKLDLPIEVRVRLQLDAPAELQAALGEFDELFRANVLVREIAFGPAEGAETVQAGDFAIGIRIDV